MQSFWWSWFLSCAIAFGARAASAQEVALDYSAPVGCPGPAEFVANVADRGARFTGADAVARARRIEVRIERRGEEFVGVLAISRDGGSSSSPEIHDPVCAEVAKGLAVIAAIALGAREEPEAPPPTGSAPQQISGTEASDPAPPKPPIEPEATREPQATRLRGNSFQKLDALPVSAGTLRFRRHARYTLSAGVDYGVVPGRVLPRWDLSISSASFVTPPSEASLLVGPILQVRWTMLGPATHRADGYATDILGLGASVSSCSGLHYDSLGWSALLCGDFGATALLLDTETADGSFERERETGFGHVGMSFDTQYAPTSWFHLGLRLGGRIQFGDVAPRGADGSSLFESQNFGGFATLGLGFQF